MPHRDSALGAADRPGIRTGGERVAALQGFVCVTACEKLAGSRFGSSVAVAGFAMAVDGGIDWEIRGCSAHLEKAISHHKKC